MAVGLAVALPLCLLLDRLALLWGRLALTAYQGDTTLLLRDAEARAAQEHLKARRAERSTAT